MICWQSFVEMDTQLFQRIQEPYGHQDQSILKINVVVTCIYYGIEPGILMVLNQTECDTTLKLAFNVDGIPVYKSTNLSVWPILCSVENKSPFIVAIFSGKGKPNCVEDYLLDFIIELEHLLNDGLEYDGKSYTKILQ